MKLDQKKLGLLALLLFLAAACVVVILMLNSQAAPQEQTPLSEELTEPAAAPTEQAETEVDRVYSTEIKDIFRHCVQVREDGGALYPLRFSDERLADYKNYPHVPYAECTAGVTMEFTTDAATVSMDYKITRNFCNTGFDIYENGEYVGNVGKDKMRGTIAYTRKSADAASDIIICLPTASHVALSNFELGSFRTDVTGDKPKVLVLGDSISQGLFGTTPSRNWPFLLAQECGLDYLNLSVGGETFRKSALDDDVPFAPDHIIVALGTNDLFYTRYINAISKDVEDYTAQLNLIYPDVPVTFITPFTQMYMNASSNMFNSTRYYALRDVIAEIAAQYGYAVIDGSDLVPAGVEYFAENDAVHLSSLGFETVASNLAKKLDIRKPPIG